MEKKRLFLWLYMGQCKALGHKTADHLLKFSWFRNEFHIFFFILKGWLDLDDSILKTVISEMMHFPHHVPSSMHHKLGYTDSLQDFRDSSFILPTHESRQQPCSLSPRLDLSPPGLCGWPVNWGGQAAEVRADCRAGIVQRSSSLLPAERDWYQCPTQCL